MPNLAPTQQAAQAWSEATLRLGGRGTLRLFNLEPMYDMLCTGVTQG
jgi:hypothetical protein